jgi:integrase-like protein
MTGTRTAVRSAGGSRRLTTEALMLQARFPARTPAASWTATCLDRHAVLARLLAKPFIMDNPNSQHERRYALIRMLDWLQAQPGRTWQERWKASGVETGQADPDWRRIPAAWLKQTGRIAPDNTSTHPVLGCGLLLLVSGDVIRPTISWFMTVRTINNLASEMARVRDPGGFAALQAATRGSVVSNLAIRGALTRIACIMAAKGGTVRDITVGDCLELLDRASEYGHYGTGGKGAYFYQLLQAIGVFPEAAPPTVRMFSVMYQGQRTLEQLIDRYDLACRPVRDLLVDYLRERQPTLDYTSLTRLAGHLGLLFWKDLEQHHPGIDSLDLAPEVAAAWKQRIRTRPIRTPGDGSTAGRLPRSDVATLLHAVRAFYLDLAHWAAEDPARWGEWAARCPIRPGDIQDRRQAAHRKSRMDQRTREHLPAVPAMTAALHQARHDAASLLAAARGASHREQFTAADQTMRRLIPPRANQRIWAHDMGGARHDLVREEDNAFWAWAAVEVLRETGIRVEELTELSHHSLVQYRLPGSGELIPLLHIAPSKTDEERLLVISPELADVLATILQRIRQPDGTVPLVVTYDREKVWNPPMPLLFQHRVGAEDRPIAPAGIARLVRLALAQTGLTGPTGTPLDITPHDFRRIFATEAIMNGMPPHIAQLLLGHKDINVTMGYKAVYPQEAISGHRAFIARRRKLRPAEEYRAPTEEEWEEFLGHFERRRVALGDCGRAYGTSCIHEHSCIRCPLLRVDPAQRPRLEDIRVNLAARIAEAEREGWNGEAEGLKVSLAAADAKLAQLDALTARRAATVRLGMPAYRDIAARTATLPQER